MFNLLARNHADLKLALAMGGVDGWHNATRICLHHAKHARAQGRSITAHLWTRSARRSFRKMLKQVENPTSLTTDQIATAVVARSELSRHRLSAGDELKQLYDGLSPDGQVSPQVHVSHQLVTHLVAGKYNGHTSEDGRRHFATTTALFATLRAEHSGHSYVLGCAARMLARHYEILGNKKAARNMRTVAERVPLHPSCH